MTRKGSFSVLYFLLIIFLSIHLSNEQKNSLKDKQKSHVPLNVPEHKLTLINQMQDLNHFNTVLDKIIVPRVVGTTGHDDVRDFIVDSMKELHWNVEIDKFNDTTPNLGELTFDNIIATYNPKAERYLILACHYDSKYFPNQEFLGATDSAVPCAMLINLAYVLRKYLENADNSLGISLQFVFFDGEEAFKEWGPTDSIYGARHLANKWDDSGHLEKIDMMILLDLLGASDPNFYSFFKQTENWYAHLIFSEDRLATAGYLAQYAYSSVNVNRAPNRYFQPLSYNTVIEDDHIPFLRKGVPILHIIPYPFPTIWHKMDDDREAVDITTVENINKIFKLFIIEYLHITV